MSDHGKLDALLEQYWNAAYAEGAAGLSHDTADLVAQCTLNDIYAELEKQLSERDAALARCVEALGTIELEASMFRVDPPMSGDELMAKFEAISEFVGNTLETNSASAQATAKVLAAARRLAEAWNRYDIVEKEGLVDASRDMDNAEIALYEAIREEQAQK